MSDETLQIRQNGMLNAQKSVLQLINGRRVHRFDNKRRFCLPLDWYDTLGRPMKLYAIPSATGRRSIDLYTPEEIDKKISYLRSEAVFDVQASANLTDIYEMMADVTVDNQNRIRISDSHLSYAQIGKDDEELVLIGVGTFISVYSVAQKPSIEVFESERVNTLWQAIKPRKEAP